MNNFNQEYQAFICSLSLRSLEAVDDKIAEAFTKAQDPLPLTVARKMPFLKRWLCFLW